MGCCNGKRQKPIEENREISLEETLEKLGKDEILDTNGLTTIQNVQHSFIVFQTALEDKLIQTPLELSAADVKQIYYFLSEIEQITDEKIEHLDLNGINFDNLLVMKEAFNSVLDLYNRLQAFFHLPRGKQAQGAGGMDPLRRDSD